MASAVDWLRKEDWGSFLKYEGEVHRFLGSFPALALCAFSFESVSLGESLALSRNYHMTLLSGRGVNTVVRDLGEMNHLPRSKGADGLTPLQQLFLTTGSASLRDRELIELVLSLHLPSPLAKQKAKACLERFESLRGFLSASPEDLEAMGISQLGILGIRMLQLLPAEMLKRKISEKPMVKSSQEIFQYLYFSMRDLKKEVFRAIYLDGRSQIVGVDDLFEGELKGVSVEVRKIQERAIASNATAVIFVHNHPSGDPAPSAPDKKLTRDLVFAGIILQINVLDHIIIGDDTYFSFADKGLLEKYQDEFLHLRIRGTNL